MKHLLIAGACALVLAGCATTGPDSLAAERTAALARASHAQFCGGVVTAHTSGVLTGAAFNKAKALCVDTDTLLDAADAALALGDAALAAQKAQQAKTLLDAAIAEGH